MAHQANFSAPAAARARGLADRALRSDALATATRTLVLTRGAIALIAIFAALSLGPPDPNGSLGQRNAATYDVPLTQPGGLAGVVLSPLARWDAIWYLEIARDGYTDEQHTAFFPLYPLLVRGLAELGGPSSLALLLAAYAVSLAALLAALVLLHKLVALELGRRLAAPTLLLMCVFPAAVFFGAPYSESLFLMWSVAAFYAARTDRWAWAGAALAAASATRSAGILLLLPVAFIHLRSGRPRREAAWLLLAPVGLAAYALHLGLAQGEPLAFLEAQGSWDRHFAGPLVGAWDGFVAALDGARQLLSGSREPVFFEKAGGDSFRVAGINLMLFATLVFALVACVGVLRRLPLAYGLYVAAALLLPLSFPVETQPLMSLPRFVAVLFPIFMWLALVCDERRITASVAAVSAAGLGLFAVQFAGWQWIS